MNMKFGGWWLHFWLCLLCASTCGLFGGVARAQSGKIAFDSDRADFRYGVYYNTTNHHDIYVVNANGRGLRRLTYSAFDDMSPVFNFAGDKIAFFSNRDDGINYRLYIMDDNGNNAHAVSSTNVSGVSWNIAPPVWSSDGSRIAVIDSDAHLHIFNAATGAEISVLTAHAVTRGSFSFSPDATRIAFSSSEGGRGNLYVCDASGANETNLYQTPSGQHIGHVQWQPNTGAQIVFESVNNTNGYAQTQLIPAAGGSPQARTEWPLWQRDGSALVVPFPNSGVDASSALPTAISPDGTFLTFSQRDNAQLTPLGYYINDMQTAIIALATGRISKLTNLLGNNRSPSWAPGSVAANTFREQTGFGRIVYSQGSDLYSMNPTGWDVIRLTQTDAAEYYPAWSPDGTQIAYLRTSNSGPYTIWLMNADGSNQRQIYTPAEGSILGSSLSWTADGGQISYVYNRFDWPNFHQRIWTVGIDGSGAHLQAGGDIQRDPDKPGYFILPEPGGSFTYPQWGRGSASGSLLMTWGGGSYTNGIWKQQNGYSVLASGSTEANNSSGAVVAVSGATWKPDGSKIAYTRREKNPNGTGNYKEEIWTMDADGSNKTVLTPEEFSTTTFSPSFDAQPVWSVNGTQILYTTRNGLAVMDADGSNRRLLSVTSAYRGYDWGNNFAFTPDDTQAPTVSITTPAASAQVKTLSITGSADDAGSGVTVVRVKLQRLSDNFYWNPYISAGWSAAVAEVPAYVGATGVAGTMNWNLSDVPNGADLAVGSYQLSAIAIDNADNQSAVVTRSFTVLDHTVPLVTVTSPVDNARLATSPATLSGTASDEVGGSGVASVGIIVSRNIPSATFYAQEYWLGGTNWTTDSNKAVSIAATLGAPNAQGVRSWTLNLPDVLNHSVYVSATATDAAGNDSQGAYIQFYCGDTQAPVTQLTRVNGNDVSQITNTIGILALNALSGSANDGSGVAGLAGSGVASVQLTLQRGSDSFYWNGAAWVEVVYPATPPQLNTSFNATTNTWTCSTALPNSNGLDIGTYYLRMTATDVVGNQDSNTKYLQVTAPYSISGRVTSGGSGLAGVRIDAVDASVFATTDSNGDYSIANIAGGEHFLTASLGGYTFAPASRHETINSANLAAINWTATPKPANDDFETPQVLAGNSGTLNDNNASASTQSGEPTHAGSNDKSLWYRWTAPDDGTLVADTIDSSFDTTMAAYTGNTLASLNQVASNDDYNGQSTSRISFAVTRGSVYSIAVASYSGGGALTLHWNFTANVTAVNDAPVASAQSVSTPEDTPLNITLSATDIDTPVANLTYRITTPPAHGTLSGTAANLTYTPAANYNGSDAFAFVANDGALDSSPATVSITVTPVNDAPVADAQTLSTRFQTPLNVTLTGSDIDTPAANLTFSIVTAPAHGTLSGSAPNLTYTPNANFSGADSFTFKINDGAADSNVATIALQVLASTAPPIANDQSVETDEDAPVAIVLSGSGVNATYSVVTQPAHGTLSGTVPNLVYTPEADFNGSDAFTFQLTNANGQSNIATVSITVRPTDDPPKTTDDAYTLIIGPAGQAQQAGVVFQTTGVFFIAAPGLLANDRDPKGGTLTTRLARNPAHGRIQVRANGSFYYLPSAGYVGADEFIYLLDNGQGTAQGRVRLNIVDKRVPELRIDTPANGATVKTIPAIKGRVRDRESGVKSVTLLWKRFDGAYWNGSAWTGSATELPLSVSGINWVYAGSLPAVGTDRTRSLLDGLYELRLSAVDKSNNLSRVTNRILVKSTTSTVPVPSSVRLSSAAASVEQGAIVLSFTGALDTASARDLANYRVKVNGVAVQISNALYASGTVGLGLFDFQTGDKIELQIGNLRDAQGKVLADGTIQLIAR